MPVSRSTAQKGGLKCFSIKCQPRYRVVAANVKQVSRAQRQQAHQHTAQPLTCVAGAGGGAIADADACAPAAEESIGRMTKEEWLTGEERPPSDERKPSEENKES